jgi:DNA polymerase III sliding clamp (beta) subunit (PCNA family)
MTMKLSRKETITALDAVKPAVAARNAIEELCHLWFDGTHVYATDGGMGVKAKFASPFKCGVPGGLFLALLNQASADTLEFDYADNVLKFKAGRSSIKLNTLPLERKVWRYPDKPTGKPTAMIKITDSFIKGLKRVLALRSGEKKRMEHHAVCIFAEGDEMDLYTTDSKSLLVMPVSEKLTGSAKKVALPREMAEQIVSQCAPGEDLKMYADHFATQANADVMLYSNVFDTSEMLDLPSYADRFSDDKVAPPFVLPEGFTAALERAVLIAGPEEPTVAIKVDGKSLKFSGHYKLGKVDEEFALAKATPKAEILIDAKTLLAVKDVKKLAVFETAVNLRSDDGFMYILASKAPAQPPAGRTRGARASAEEDA